MRVCFGDFELDAAARELRRGGEAVRVEPQVFDLIVYLIEKRARVVSRDDIIDAVWDGRIVSDAAISSRIKSARQALGDDGRAQAVIKTVHGKGFRFIADVAEPTDARAASRDARPSGAPRRVRPEETAARFGSRIGFKLAVPAAAVLSAAALAFLFFGRDDVAGPAGTRLAVLPIANATASEGYDWVELGLMSLVAHVLETEAGRAMVSPRSVVSAAATWSAPRAGGLAVDDVTLRRLRSAYGASHVVAARLGGEPGAFTIDFQIVSPRGTAPMRTIAGSEPTALATRLAREILATLPRSGETPTAGKTVSDDPFIAEAYARGRALQIKGAGAEARDLFKVASEQDPENFWLRYEFAVSTRMAGELDASETLLRELLDRVRATGEPRGEFAVLNALGRIAALRGDRAAAVELYERALEIAEREGGADDVGVVLTNLGIEERVRGNLDVAEAHLGRALTAFDDAGYDAPPGFLLNSLALLRIRRGDLTAGEDYLERAVASLELAGEDRAVAAALRNLAEMRERRGRWPEAADQLERSLTLRRAGYEPGVRGCNRYFRTTTL
ncbi:MAG: tetratricopeptide repeat protein [Pseudomonadota bacterium]